MSEGLQYLGEKNMVFKVLFTIGVWVLGLSVAYGLAEQARNAIYGVVVGIALILSSMSLDEVLEP